MKLTLSLNNLKFAVKNVFIYMIILKRILVTQGVRVFSILNGLKA